MINQIKWLVLIFLLDIYDPIHLIYLYIPLGLLMQLIAHSWILTSRAIRLRSCAVKGIKPTNIEQNRISSYKTFKHHFINSSFPIYFNAFHWFFQCVQQCKDKMYAGQSEHIFYRCFANISDSLQSPSPTAD